MCQKKYIHDISKFSLQNYLEYTLIVAHYLRESSYLFRRHVSAQKGVGQFSKYFFYYRRLGKVH